MSTLFRGLINNIRSDYVYMSTTGDDNNTGEADSPVKTLKRALEIASVNGRGVFVKNGTYNLGDGFGTDPNNTYYSYYFSGAGKPYQGDQWGNTDLLKSAFYYKIPILGEFVPYRELSNPDYTFTKTNDNSLSYSTIQVSPNPNFGIDELRGKSLIINGYNNLPDYCYRIIKNTADTIYVVSIVGTISKISIYDCPTLQIPSGKTAQFGLFGFAMCNLKFEIIGNFISYGTEFYDCYFFASTQKTISAYEDNNKIKSHFSQCFFDNVNTKGLLSWGSGKLYRCAFRGVSSAMINISYAMSCSAWECGDFYQLDSGAFADKILIQRAGGQDNTGNFININTSGGYKSSNAEIILQGSTTTNAFPINIKDIQFANGYKTSLDAIPYQLLTRKQAIKLVENEDGLKIWVSG